MEGGSGTWGGMIDRKEEIEDKREREREGEGGDRREEVG